MKLDRRNSILTHGVSFDTETHLIQPGLLTPPVVCGSIGWYDAAAGRIKGALVDKVTAVNFFLEAIRDPSKLLILHNGPYDLAVCAVELAKRGIDVMPEIFQAYDDGRIYCTQTAAQLYAIGTGTLGLDPRSGMPLRHPETGKPCGYNLAVVTWLATGRKGAKANDRWRERYYELEDIPIDQWEPDARQYPVDDAVNTFESAVCQIREQDLNLDGLSFQAFAAWVLHLGACWGFSVDPVAVRELEERVTREREERLGYFLERGLLKQVKEKGELVVKANGPAIRKRAALAYGCTGVCDICKGSARTNIRIKHVDGVTSYEEKKGDIWCVKCSATGLDLDTGMVPRSDPSSKFPWGQVQTGRDALFESGDELLIEYSAFSEHDKLRTVYIPYLKTAVAEDGTVRPLNLRPNVLVATGRVSYRDVIHQLPREGGVRECFVARSGYLLASCDYTGGELVTHAQSTLWLKQKHPDIFTAPCEMARAIQEGGSGRVHGELAARMTGTNVDEFLATYKNDKFLTNARTAAKWLNFGLPGGMGVPTLVLTCRKLGPDTASLSGKTYRGLRFCILVGGAATCGDRKVIEWNKKPITPTCAACLEIAQELRETWFTQWPENRDYFVYIARELDERGYLVQHVSNRVRGGMTFCAGANTLFQGLLADIMKLAVIRISQEAHTDKSSALYGSHPILVPHDELLAEVPIDTAHEAATRIGELMVAAGDQMLTDLRLEAEPCLMTRWYKNAEPVYENGRLIPWVPNAS